VLGFSRKSEKNKKEPFLMIEKLNIQPIVKLWS
jgi:hypothetical protein